MAPVVEKITRPLHVGEGPHWDVARQCLFFNDILGKNIHKYVPATGVHTTSAALDGRVGFVIPVEGSADRFVVGVERRVVLVQWSGEDGAPASLVRVIAEVDRHQPTTRLNDAKADPRGRLFAGTMGNEDPPGVYEEGNGSLYKLEADGSHETLFGGVGISNGLAWDVGKKAFYYVDSLAVAVHRYDYDVDTGAIANKKMIFDLRESNVPGFPDGMTIDTDGNLWVANFNGSQVIQVDPRSGKLLQKVAIPALQVTSVAFGGADLDELYVTTASMNIDGEQKPPCGALFRVTGLGARGLPMSSVKLDL